MIAALVLHVMLRGVGIACAPYTVCKEVDYYPQILLGQPLDFCDYQNWVVPGYGGSKDLDFTETRVDPTNEYPLGSNQWYEHLVWRNNTRYQIYPINGNYGARGHCG